MFNLLKADLIKLRYSKMWIMSIMAVVLLFVIYAVSGDAAFVYGSNGEYYILGEGVGFMSMFYLDPSNPLSGEIMRTAMSYTAFIWLIILVFSGAVFTKEYQDNTIKLSIAYGASRFKLYLSKLIVITLFSFILYYGFTLSIFIHASIFAKFTPNISDIFVLLKLISLNFLVMIVFILVTLILCMLVKNVGAVNTAICFFICSCPMVYLMVWDKMDVQPFLVKVFLKINPMYYWSTLCAYNLDNNIIGQTITYFILGMAILIPSTYLLLKKQEIK